MEHIDKKQQNSLGFYKKITLKLLQDSGIHLAWIFPDPHPNWYQLRLLLVAHIKDSGSPFYCELFPKNLLEIIFKFSIAPTQVNMHQFF